MAARPLLLFKQPLFLFIFFLPAISSELKIDPFFTKGSVGFQIPLLIRHPVYLFSPSLKYHPFHDLEN